MLGLSNWYNSSLNFHMPGELCVFLLFIGACPLWLVLLVVLVAIFIASIVVLWKSLIFQSILLRLAFLIMFSVTCTAFFAISLICAVICFTMATIRMIIMTSACRGGVMFELLSFWASCINYVSAMSHPRSGILLVGTAFLPSLVFPVCSSS